MKTHTSLPRKHSGFGLLEVILVFAIVIGAAAVVFSVYQSAQPAAEADRAVSYASTISGNMQTFYQINHSYRGLDNAMAIKANIIPSAMVNSPTLLNSEWGPVTVGPSAIGGGP